jgi:hypothetical protein
MAPLWYHLGAVEHDARVVAVNVRLPADVHAALVRAAEAHERSLQREIVVALRQYAAERLMEQMPGALAEPQRAQFEELAAHAQARLAPLQAEVQRLVAQAQPELQRLVEQATAQVAPLQPELRRLAEQAGAEADAMMRDPSVQATLASIREQLARQQEELRRLRDLVETKGDEGADRGG